MNVTPATTQTSIALLFSGGTDSTYAACRLSENFATIHLFTYERQGFFGSRVVLCRVEKLRARFPHVRFIHHFIDYDAFYRDLTYERYPFNLSRHGFLVLATCGFCKVAMHWRNLIYCIDHTIQHAADGATVESKEYVEQNPRILMPEIKMMYRHFGITHVNPVYQEDLSTERELYTLGITDTQKVKRTTAERQIYCSQHILYAMLLRLYLDRMSFSDFEQRMKIFFSEKIRYIIRMTEEYVLNREKSKVARLIKNEHA